MTKVTQKHNNRTYLSEGDHRLCQEKHFLGLRGVHRNDKILWTPIIWGEFCVDNRSKSGFEIVPRHKEGEASPSEVLRGDKSDNYIKGIHWNQSKNRLSHHWWKNFWGKRVWDRGLQLRCLHVVVYAKQRSRPSIKGEKIWNVQQCHVFTPKFHWTFTSLFNWKVIIHFIIYSCMVYLFLNNIFIDVTCYEKFIENVIRKSYLLI